MSIVDCLACKACANTVLKSDAGANVVENFREVSDSVWVSFEAGIIEKTLKED